MLPLKKSLGFNLKTRKKNKRHGSIKLDLKTKGGRTLARKSSSLSKISSLNVIREPQGKERLPHAPEDNTPSTIEVDGIKFIKDWHVGGYTTQIPTDIEHIGQLI